MTPDYAARAFKEGDQVEFELARDKLNPRWDFPHDSGWSGVWQRATVHHVSRHAVLVTWFSRGQQRFWGWPAPGHPEYSEDQWDRPGFLRHSTAQQTPARAEQKPAPHPCECDRHVLWTSGCQCGGV